MYIGMARHQRRSWHSRSTQDDQRPLPASGAGVVAQDGVLLPMHLRIPGAESVTIDLAGATVPGSPPVAALPLPPSMSAIRAKNGRLRDRPRKRPVRGKSGHIMRHLFFVFERVCGDA